MDEKMQKVTQIAKVCHEANRVLTALVKDVPEQPAWNDAPEEMRKSSVEGVLYALDNPDSDGKSRHASWCASKIKDGWVFGDVKDPAKKTHPSLVEYEKLSEGTKAKDYLFGAIVKAMTT